MKALVVGGTGPTGPFLVNGLIKRGYDVTIFHRGTHEIPEIPSEVEHIHADPHFQETIDEALSGRTFDLAIATYGRIRFVARSLVGKVGRFIGVGGALSYRGFFDPYALSPAGLKVAVPEDAPVVDSDEKSRAPLLIAQTEQSVLECHPTAAYFRYPYVYGPYQVVPREWSVIRRILDNRPHIIVPDGGLTLLTHGYAANLAHAILLAVDQPDASAGQLYNCGDESQLTIRQVIEVIASTMDYELEVVGMPNDLARPARPYTMLETPHHRVLDLTKIKNQLGYIDLYPVEEAIRKTVQWYLEHRPEPGGDVERNLLDPFNYRDEDRLIAAYKSSMQSLLEIPFDFGTDQHHPYAHPKEPGQDRDHRGR